MTLAAPFWGAADWEVDEFALPHDTKAKLPKLSRLIILQGDEDEVVAKNHPQLYVKLLPQAVITMLPGVDHEAASAGPAVLAALESITLA